MPEVHDRFNYSFQVASTKYYGKGHLSKRNLQVGQNVNISYSPDNPAISTEGDPVYSLRAKLFSIGLVDAIFPAFGTLIIYHVIRLNLIIIAKRRQAE